MKNNKGITLIALVITIIVLLILAGITIAMLTGENGILSNATKSKAYNELGAAKDKVALTVSEAITDYFNHVYVKGSSQSDATQGSGNYDSTNVQTKAKTAVSGMTPGTDLPAGVTFSQTVQSSGDFTLSYGDYSVTGHIGADGALTWDAIQP